MSKWNELVEAYRKYDKPLPLKVASLAQWIVESGRGSSQLAQLYLNFGGLKWRNEMAKVATPVVYKAHDGKATYCRFSSIQKFIDGYWTFIARAPYKGFENHAATPLDYLKFIAKQGYAQDPNYIKKVAECFEEAEKLLGAELPVGQESHEPGERETPGLNENLAPTVVIIVGHEKKAPGASLANPAFKSEYDYNTEVAKKVKALAEKSWPALKLHTVFRDGVGISGAYNKAAAFKPDACIELHFNAANGVAQGTETLCSIETKDQNFAKIVQGKICQAFGRTGNSRGVKVLPRGARGAGNVYGLPGYANCLVEPFFGDNKAEAKLAVEKIDAYAQSLLEAIKAWTESVGLG